MPKFTIEQTYVKTDVWYDIEATSKDEAYKKIIGKDPDDERYGIDTDTEINKQTEE
jgi:hypothetical protein